MLVGRKKIERYGNQVVSDREHLALPLEDEIPVEPLFEHFGFFSALTRAFLNELRAFLRAGRLSA